MNKFFTYFFLIEVLLKIMALGSETYTADYFNTFEFFVAVCSVLERQYINSSITSSFRVFRFFKLVDNIQ